MGAPVVYAALSDLSPLVVELAAQVLSLADRCAVVASPRRGCWMAAFSLGASSAMQEEQCERVASITAAARELANKRSLEIFGPASQQMACLTTVCIAGSSTLDLENAMRAAAKMALDAGAHAAVQTIV